MTTRLSQQELQNLRHLIYSHETAADKFKATLNNVMTDSSSSGS